MRVLACSALALLALVGAAQPAAAQEAAPAGRVGRVSYISGAVASYHPGDADWAKAVVNFPVADKDWLATDKGARAEVRIGPDTIDIANDSEFGFASLQDKTTQIAVVHGEIELILRELPSGETAEIDIPQGGIWLTQPGRYNVAAEATPDQPARITVFTGSARFAGGGVDLTIKAGESVTLSGDGRLKAATEPAKATDFTRWCEDRDDHPERLAGAHHVPAAMTGYEELETYGRWQSVPEYGEVWYPTSTPVGWMPYRHGYWDWAAPWGWTWISEEPWGFAPFHYGRWAFINSRWGWVPGKYTAAPVYAPALVQFISDPAVVVIAGAGPIIGWFPLGPDETYRPGYARDPNYVRAINAASVRDPAKLEAALGGTTGIADARFVNRRFATVVPQQAFAAGTRAAAVALPVSDQRLQRVRADTRPAIAGGARNGQSPASTSFAQRPRMPDFAHLAPMHNMPAALTSSQGAPPGQPNLANLPPPAQDQGTAHAAPIGRKEVPRRHDGAAAAAVGLGAAAAGAMAAPHFAHPATPPYGQSRYSGPRYGAPRYGAPRYGGPRYVGRQFGGPMPTAHPGSARFGVPRAGMHVGGGPARGGASPHAGGGGSAGRHHH